MIDWQIPNKERSFIGSNTFDFHCLKIPIFSILIEMENLAPDIRIKKNPLAKVFFCLDSAQVNIVNG